MSDGYETEELTRIEAALDALVSPTSEDVFQATRPFDERAIASVAATRGGGGSLTPPVTLTVVDPANPVLTVNGTGGAVEAFRVIDTNGTLAFEAGGPNGNRMTGSNPIGTVLHVTTAVAQTAAAITVVDTNGNDCFTVGGINGVTLSADAVTGNTELQITTSALTYRDENGDAVVDIEGGFVNLGPAGEVSVTGGAVYVTLPLAPGPSGSLWNDGGTVKVAP